MGIPSPSAEGPLPASGDVQVQVTQPPRDRGHRGRVGVAGSVIQQSLARPERPWAPGLAASPQRPGARRRLPQVLLVGERPVARPRGQRRPFGEARRRDEPVQACPGDLPGEVELVEQHPEAVGPRVGPMVFHVGSYGRRAPPTPGPRGPEASATTARAGGGACFRRPRTPPGRRDTETGKQIQPRRRPLRRPRPGRARRRPGNSAPPTAGQERYGTAKCTDNHRNHVMPVTDKKSILYYTRHRSHILIALGADDGETQGPDEGRRRASTAADSRPCATTTRDPRPGAPAGELHLVLRSIWGGPRGRRDQPDPDADRRAADVPPLRGAKMTSHQQPDVDRRDERARAAADRQEDNDTLAKSYRYLRLAMVGLLLCLAVAVIVQSWNQRDILG